MAKKLTTVELWYLLKYHPEESVRISAGNKAVEIYVQEGDYWGLEDLLEDDRVPEDVRILAGNKLGEAKKKVVEKYSKGDYWALELLLRHDRVPEDVRILAGNKLGELINKWAKLLNTNTD
jgi:hypothetical protein